MAPNTSPIFELVPRNAGAQFTSADASNLKTIMTAGVDGSRIDSIICCSNDTAAVNLAFYIGNGTTDFYIGNVPVPAGSGYTTIAKVDGMNLLAPAMQGFLQIAPGYTIKANCVATMTAGKTLNVVIIGGDF